MGTATVSDEVLPTEHETTANHPTSRRTKTKTKPNPSHAVIAGYVAGCSGTIVGYPLDSLKVWMQTATVGKNAHLPRPGSTTPRTPPTYPARMLTTGYRFLRASYSGVATPLVTVGAVQSVNFATYDAARRFLHRRRNPASGSEGCPAGGSLGDVAVAASVGGGATACLTAPFVAVKIHQQINGSAFRVAFREVFAVESGGWGGVRPLRAYGAAFVPHVAFESVGRAVYVTTYEHLKRCTADSGEECGAPLSLGDRMACAGASGIAAWGAFFPCDVLRNRMYAAAVGRGGTAGGSIVGTVRIMYDEGAFYRGFSVSILRAAPVAAAVLPVYDVVMEWLGSGK